MKKRDSVIVEINKDQWQELDDLYLKNFNPNDTNPRTWGVLLGQVDLTNGRTKWVAFSHWEYVIINAAFWLVNLIRKTDEPSPEHPYVKGAFWLGHE